MLEYTEWRNFSKVLDKAKIACESSGSGETSHFVEVNKMVKSGVADIPLRDIKLSRYACYLIAQNGDSRKRVIALAQTYFAVQTRRENIQGKDAANETHYQVGAKVRQTIEELGGTMPENLPTPDKSIKQLRKESPSIETADQLSIDI